MNFSDGFNQGMYDGDIDINITNKIVVTFTSWSKRINYCKQCVENIFKQTIKPDLIYLNLSVEEFAKQNANMTFSELIKLRKDYYYEIMIMNFIGITRNIT